MATATSTSISTDTRCTHFFSPKGVRTSTINCTPGCRKLDAVAMWFINGLASAFFASLERCSCIRIATAEDDDRDDANDVPLICNDANFQASTTRRGTTGGKAKKYGLSHDFMDG